MIRKTMMVLAGAAFGASLLAAPATAAPSARFTQADDVSAAAWADCPAARTCFWSGLNGTGVIAYFRVGDANLGDTVGPRGMNNNAESAWNRTSQRWCFYDLANYGSLLGVMDPGDRGDVVPGLRNRATSLRPC